MLAARAFTDTNQEILDILLVQQFTSGLRNAEMRSRLIKKRCERLQVALGAARLIEIAEREVKSKRIANIMEVSAEAGTSAAQQQVSVDGPLQRGGYPRRNNFRDTFRGNNSVQSVQQLSRQDN